jgi:diguanylate cyclase (GGDEF)-like protein
MIGKTDKRQETRVDELVRPAKAQRRLSSVLMRITLLVALVLGIAAGLFQLAIDLRQEKAAVALNAGQFLDSVKDSTATAVYNYFDEAAEQVAEGLFTQPAIQSVTIFASGEDQPMVARSRMVERTLPKIGTFTQIDEITLNRELRTPPGAGPDEVIGSVSIVVDRSVVPPAIVNRMMLYFILACVKNFVLGVLLVVFVFASLARHVIVLADVVAAWRPGDNDILLPKPPHFLRNTELDTLGSRITNLASQANLTINQLSTARDEVSRSNTQLATKSQDLSRIVDEQVIELQNANSKLTEMADRDSLTGLYNRGFFDRATRDVTSELAGSCKDLSLLMIDVDFFKAYNDCYGHHAGDICLIDVANRIRSVVEAESGLLARYGGEEFIAMFHGCTRDSVEMVGQKIVACFAKSGIRHIRSTVADHVTVSVGLASQKINTIVGIESLYSVADEALYEAKRSGRNQLVVSTRELKNSVAKRKGKTDDLIRAIDNSEIVPFFQPQIDGRSGALVGIEALARWCRDDGSIIPPDEFLPYARELNMVHLIDQTVLSKSMLQIDRWAENGIHVPRFSVNVSLRHLTETDFQKATQNFKNVAGTQLSFELLESIFLDAADEEIPWQIDQLDEIGIDVEVDDFGTGHTSILGLMRIKPKRLKIARELVDPIVSDLTQRNVIKNIIALGESLGIEVLAEGVETQKHVDILIGLGCPFHQGYYYAKPMPAAEFELQLHNNSALAVKNVRRMQSHG